MNNQTNRMKTNRYFRIPRKEINALSRVNVRYITSDTAPEIRARIARALGLDRSDYYVIERLRTGADVIGYAVDEHNVGFIIEDARWNINTDVGAGWVALTIGPERGNSVDLGLHVDELNSAQLEFVRALVRRVGINVELPDYATAETGASL